MEPSRHPAKHVPVRVPELEKTLGAVYQEYFEGDKFKLYVKQ